MSSSCWSSFRFILPTTNNITFTSSSSSQPFPFLLPVHSSSLQKIPFPSLRSGSIHNSGGTTTNTCSRFLGNSRSWNCRRRRGIRFLAAADAAPTDPDRASDSSYKAANGNRTTPKSRKDFLLEYVNNVQPEFLDLFVKRAPQQVVEAMRQTITNMIGTLPPQFFAVTVTTVAENLAQLMYSVIMTGYMFRNAQFRLELQQCLMQAVLPEKAQHDKGTPDYAPGTQKKVTGEVIRWNKVSGTEKIDAIKYIELLEGEIKELKHQVSRSSNGQNELLEYLKSLEPQNLKELTTTAGEDAVLAMNTFIKRLLEVSDPTQMKTTATTTSAPELAKLLYWLMVVGYSIRNIEVRLDLEKVLGAPTKLAELPPGENI